MVIASRLSVRIVMGSVAVSLCMVDFARGAELATAPTVRPKASPGATTFFEAKVRPLLAESCLKCHGPTKQSSGLRLDSREAMLKGGTSGPAVVPGDPMASLVVQAVTYEHEEIKMPPKGRLGDPDVSTLKQWITEGAYWPEASARSTESAGNPSKTHWAFQPVKPVPSPLVKDTAWVRNPVDAFVLAGLERNGLSPSPPAERRALIRRVSFDLLGLPPSADEVDAFVSDARVDAYERLVDRLLASPMYGERWGRHWLDVARYADTKGYVFTEERRYPFSYTYRDYVVDAFNRDLPYDQFIAQQLAADQLPLGGNRGPLAAMGFLTVGRRFLNDQNEIIDDRIDVVTRGFLGMTVTCARCHDHKFDPIPTADYYSLYGVFASSVEPGELPRLLPDGSKEVVAEDEQARKVQAAIAQRDAYVAGRHADAQVDFRRQFSKYFRAAFELGFDPRHPELAKRATADRLDVNRLRSLAFSLQRGLELVTPDPGRESILQVWRTYSGLKVGDFKARSIELASGLKAKGIHPLLARAVVAKPPAVMTDVVNLFTELFQVLESQLREAEAKKADKLADADWESFRQAIFGPNGLASLPPDSTGFLLKKEEKEQLATLDKAIEKVRASGPPPVPRGMVLNDAPTPIDPHIFVRGNPGRPGKPVPRQFLKVLSGPERKPFPAGSGRLGLARAIADRENPLTARVLVNRVWAWHFGTGLVSTPSDFGMRSDPPSHPELLDWLAEDLVRNGWSIKSLHRNILVSNAYRQGSELRPDCLERDPQNRLLWRFNRHRLDFEAMRDAVLATSGAIDRTIGGPSVAISEAPFPTRRTLYGFIDRQNLDPVYRTFDFAVPDATTPRRFVTTVPQQALFLMNSPFLQEQARLVSAEIEREVPGPVSDPKARVEHLYRRVLGRMPSDRERELAARILAQPSAGQPATEADRAKSPMLLPGEQLAQVLLLTNEFSFVD